MDGVYAGEKAFKQFNTWLPDETEGAFVEWGYVFAKREFRNQIIIEMESWILGNKGENPNISAEENVKLIYPSFEMMLKYMSWTEAADLIIKGMEGAVAAKTVTYDFARLMSDAIEVKCSEFGDAIITHMK